MLSTLFTLLAFCACGRAALVNRTIEDSDPLVQYNCTIERCDADASHSNPCSIDGAEFRTFTAFFTPCQVTFSFTGTAVYTFLGCKSTSNCEFEIDNTGKHPNIRPAAQVPITGLSYFNDSLPNGLHTLVMTSSNGFVAFDSVTHTRYDIGSMMSPHNPYQCPHKPNPHKPNPHKPNPPKYQLPRLHLLLLSYMRRANLYRADRRRRTWWDGTHGRRGGASCIFETTLKTKKQTPGRISMVDPYPPSEVDIARSPQAEYTALTQQINRLQERQLRYEVERQARAGARAAGGDVGKTCHDYVDAHRAPHAFCACAVGPYGQWPAFNTCKRGGGAAPALFPGLIMNIYYMDPRSFDSVGKREISDFLFSQNSTVKSRAPLSGFSHLELVEAVFAQEEWHQGYQKVQFSTTQRIGRWQC
ncbi:hypothetical protein B0H13DRAFT_2273313 [Mycena leptocephala]|nr:hypothetical protein B0H13DRAFT_2273313 [Mycena leptocephala]